jgi:hypothetical protein
MHLMPAMRRRSHGCTEETLRAHGFTVRLQQQCAVAGAFGLALRSQLARLPSLHLLHDPLGLERADYLGSVKIDHGRKMTSRHAVTALPVGGTGGRGSSPNSRARRCQPCQLLVCFLRPGGPLFYLSG